MNLNDIQKLWENGKPDCDVQYYKPMGAFMKVKTKQLHPKDVFKIFGPDGKDVFTYCVKSVNHDGVYACNKKTKSVEQFTWEKLKNDTKFVAKINHRI